jgi:hypothetical protein
MRFPSHSMAGCGSIYLSSQLYRRAYIRKSRFRTAQTKREMLSPK